MFIFFFAYVFLSFCFVPPNLSLYLSSKHKHTQFIYHPNLHSLFINELTKSQNYLTLMGHLFSPILPLLHHTCLLKYLCWLPGNIYVTKLPFCNVISCQYESKQDSTPSSGSGDTLWMVQELLLICHIGSE